MSDTFNAVTALVAQGEVRISEHGYDELAADNILVADVLDGVASGLVVEDHPQFAKGPSVLVLQRDASGRRFCQKEAAMSLRTKLIHEGRYAAEIPVDPIEDESGWSPYLSVADALTLDAVRDALCRGDVTVAAQYGRVFELVPVTG